MATLTVNVDDEVEQAFRKMAAKTYKKRRAILVRLLPNQ